MNPTMNMTLGLEGTFAMTEEKLRSTDKHLNCCSSRCQVWMYTLLTVLPQVGVPWESLADNYTKEHRRKKSGVHHMPATTAFSVLQHFTRDVSRRCHQPHSASELLAAAGWGQAGRPPGAATRSPHGPAQFLIRHATVFLLLAPQLGHGLGPQKLENALLPVLPLHEALVELRVDEDVPDELPQVGASGGYGARVLVSGWWSYPPGPGGPPGPGMQQVLKATALSPAQLDGDSISHSKDVWLTQTLTKLMSGWDMSLIQTHSCLEEPPAWWGPQLQSKHTNRW